MKRRQFLQTAGAVATLGSLPGPALSAPATGAVTRYGMTPYAWAKYTARINKKLTPEMLTRFCGFSQGEAARMIRRLTYENVLLAPDASGVSRTNAEVLIKTRQRREALARAMRKLRENAKAVLEDAEQPETPPSIRSDPETDQ